MNPNMMQKIQEILMSDPEIRQLMSKPDVMQKFMAMQQSGNIQQYMNDPDIQKIISKIQSSGLGGMGGMGW
eukprot:CAMPEP_0114659720 /NCGR_PEP_ID=MMETSP0191-20121206/18398_1 /TAXON_ID=126664 /ORGANISM="Sorites sp." /LENGTH=70 /DNA_ID=CAMNT_0001885761 /DNA_START=45 /DNA_END=257 /DNA_ORIENTATION=+